MVNVPKGTHVVAAVQAGFAMLTQMLDSHADEIDPAMWNELTAEQKFLTVGVILGAFNGLADFAQLHGLDTTTWLAGLALDVTARASGYPT